MAKKKVSVSIMPALSNSNLVGFETTNVSKKDIAMLVIDEQIDEFTAICSELNRQINTIEIQGKKNTLEIFNKLDDSKYTNYINGKIKLTDELMGIKYSFSRFIITTYQSALSMGYHDNFHGKISKGQCLFMQLISHVEGYHTRILVSAKDHPLYNELFNMDYVEKTKEMYEKYDETNLRIQDLVMAKPKIQREILKSELTKSELGKAVLDEATEKLKVLIDTQKVTKIEEGLTLMQGVLIEKTKRK